MTACARCGSEWHSVSRCPWPLSKVRFPHIEPRANGGGRKVDFNSGSLQELNEINDLLVLARGGQPGPKSVESHQISP